MLNDVQVLAVNREGTEVEIGGVPNSERERCKLNAVTPVPEIGMIGLEDTRSVFLHVPFCKIHAHCERGCFPWRQCVFPQVEGSAPARLLDRLNLHRLRREIPHDKVMADLRLFVGKDVAGGEGFTGTLTSAAGEIRQYE